MQISVRWRLSGGKEDPLAKAKDYQSLRERIIDAPKKNMGTVAIHMSFRRFKAGTESAPPTVLHPEYRRLLIIPRAAINRGSKSILGLINQVNNPILVLR